MNLQEELKALKERIAELEELAKEEQEFPQNGDMYWLIEDSTEVSRYVWEGDDFDNQHLPIGNVFRTQEQAQFAVEKLKVEEELRKFSKPFEPMEGNFFMAYNSHTESLEINRYLKTNTQGVIYFGSREELRQAVESVGVDRIKKYLFGVEDLIND